LVEFDPPLKMQYLTLVLSFMLWPALVSSQSLVLVGGALADENTPIWNKVVELAGGKGVAKIGIFCTASATPEDSGAYYVDMFVNVYGAASATYIPVTENSNNADDPTIAALVRQQTGFFFGGGDQERVIKALRPNGRDTLVLEATKEVFNAGGVVGGSSAGTSCHPAGPMITGGYSWEACVYGAFPGGYNDNYPYDLSYNELGGLGFMQNYLLDTHFSQRGREARLIRLIQDTRMNSIGGTTRGFGVDEDTALVVTGIPNQPVATVIGTTGGVFMADVTNIVVTPSTTTNYQKISTNYLTLDDSIDLTTGVVTFASWKFNLKGQEYYNNAVASSDIFSERTDGEWASTAKRLFDNKRDDTVTSLSSITRPNPRFQVIFDRTLAQGYGGYLPSDSKTFVVSYQNLQVAIREN